jgi:hypothetical protein
LVLAGQTVETQVVRSGGSVSYGVDLVVAGNKHTNSGSLAGSLGCVGDLGESLLVGAEALGVAQISAIGEFGDINTTESSILDLVRTWFVKECCRITNSAGDEVRGGLRANSSSAGKEESGDEGAHVE